MAPHRHRQPAGRGLRRHVVLETAAGRRFSALDRRHAGVPAQRRRCRRRRAARLRSRAARHRCLGVAHPAGSAGIGGPRRRPLDPRRGRICPLGRARRRFSAARFARLRSRRDVFRPPLAALLAGIDEVHTMTSLAGFEALLRSKQVTVYGRPFYAGWGLTTDRMAIERGRRLTLEELVAGALILYPRYLDPVTRLPCGPEIIIERLDQPDAWRAGPLVMARRLQGRLARRWSEMRAAAPPAGLAGEPPPR